MSIKLIPLTTTLNENTMCLDEAWEKLQELTTRITHDNTLYDGGYPIDVRRLQIRGILVIAQLIDDIHEGGSRDIRQETLVLETVGCPSPERLFVSKHRN